MTRKMQRVIYKTDQYKKADTVNYEGHRAWTMDIEERLIQLLHTGTIEHTFYASQSEIAEKAIDVFESAPVELMEKWIPRGRNDGFMRTSPILALTVLFERDTAAAKRIFNSVINTGNDLTAFIDARRSRGFGYGRGVKSAINSWLKTKLNEFYAIKYGNDVVHGIRVARPSREDMGETASSIVDYLMARLENKTFVVPETFIKLQAFEDLKALKNRGEYTVDEVYALIQRGRLDYTVVTGIGLKMDAPMWKMLAQQMGVFALLRHLKTFERNGLQDDEEFVESLFGRLTAENLTRAKVFPFRVWQAWMAVESDTFRDRLGLLMNSFIPQADFSEWGKVCICPDVSCSMTRCIGAFLPHEGNGHRSPKTTMRYVDIAAMFAGVLYKGIEGSKVIPFDTAVYPHVVPNRDADVIDIIIPIISAGGNGTHMELPLSYLMGDSADITGIYRRDTTYSRYSKTVKKTPIKFDTFIYITDGEEWGTGLLEQWTEYKKLYPESRLVLIRIDPYETNPFSEEHQTKYDIIQVAGWNNSAIDYIKYMLGGTGTVDAEETS